MPEATYDDCWLRYEPVAPTKHDTYKRRCHHVYAAERSPQHGAIRDELRRGLTGLLGGAPHFWQHPPRSVDAFVAIGQPGLMEVVADSVDTSLVANLHDDGYLIKTADWEGSECLIITAPSDRGLVYGTFHFLRLLSIGEPIDDLHLVEEPAVSERLVNQWDEPFRGSVERGYGGESIFRWDHLPSLRERYTDYARLLASVGINGIVFNDVNTTRPSRPGDLPHVDAVEGVHLIDEQQLPRVAALSSVFDRYGIRPFLAVNFAAPMTVGDLETADPRDAAVIEWWERAVEHIYERIPSFGGFLVKADSEGEPGPFDYDRSHAEGANMLARALRPHGGRVWWRAFVYHEHADRAVQAGEVFDPLDGEFDDNVTLQVKNGPIDFQPREPVSTLFSTMSATDLACELQITQEYTGQGLHTCFHVPMWREILTFDTHASGSGTPLWKRLAASDGEGIVGVGNVGEDHSWFGTYLGGSNLYGFGRLAWDPTLSPTSIARTWTRQTFGDDPERCDAICDILLDSWQASVEYHTGGLGLLHMMYNGSARLENHYDPAPEEWQEYHGATAEGIGVDRTEFAQQYPDPISSRFGDPETCPEELLLFFHHLPYTYELDDGTTVIQRIYDNCQLGVDRVRQFRDAWASIADSIDDRRSAHIGERFDDHLLQATRWRETLSGYFYEQSGIPDAGDRQ